MAYKKSILAASISVFTIVSAAPLSVDISGVTLGNSLGQARTAMAVANSEYTFGSIKDNTGNVFGVNAIASKTTLPTDHFQVLSVPNGKIWFIGRGQSLGEGKRFPKETLLRSLLEKYGEPSGNGSSYPYWHFDLNGALFKGEFTQSPCYVSEQGGIQIKKQLGASPIGASVQFPILFNPKCSTAIEVKYLVEQKTGLISHWVIIAYDSKTQMEEVRKSLDESAQRDKNKVDAERNSGNKPKL